MSISMEKASRSICSGSQVSTTTPSPRLVRSRSGSNPRTAITTPERISSQRFSTSERFTNNAQRSKSTSRSSTTSNHNYQNIIKPTLTTSQETNRKKNSSSGDGFRKFLKREASPNPNGNTHVEVIAFGAQKSSMKMPSAWALSPGRTSLGSPIPVWYESPLPVKAASGGGGGGGVTKKMLKYFTQRKVSRVEEEQYHQFRILHNRLLQWRFVNARAEIAMASVNNVAKIRLFSVWLKTLVIRKIVIQKRIALQNVKHLIKLHQILNPQFPFLMQWEKLEKRNQESIARLIRKLSALSTILPLTHDLKADTQSMCEALDTAIEVMDSIEPLITRFQAQAERILYQVTELITASKQEEEYLRELLGIVPIITSSMENEKSIQVHLIQTEMEPNIGNHVYRVGQSYT